VKLLVMSDLHNEFKQPYPAAQHAAAWSEADVIVLAGDIDTGVRGIQWARESLRGKPIVYVAGNHEFYGGTWLATLAEMRDAARDAGVHFLEDDGVEIEGIRFLGCSLWTDFDLFGEKDRQWCMFNTQKVLADYKRIKNDQATRERYEVNASPWKLKAVHTRARHLVSRAWLERELARGEPDRTVVVTHHYPSIESCAPQWRDDPVSAGFGSQLPPALLARAKLWIHGHTHDSCDYTLRHEDEGNLWQTRVVCNPRGYPLAGTDAQFENARFDPELKIEI
jgi:DNA repair exonuclease SbcCD nuclease subunit